MKELDFTEIELTYIVPIYLENDKSDSLSHLINTYNKYSHEITDKIHFIIVDDCSPISPTLPPNNLQYTLVRIEDNIAWNQGGARNLGVSLANSSKIIVTDLDHHFPERTLEHLIETQIPNSIFQFTRKKNGIKQSPHAGTYFCSKSTYYKSLGFDEEFCGNYGYDDIYFLRLQKRLGTLVKKKRRFHVNVIEHSDDNIESQHHLVRDNHVNKELLYKKIEYFKTKTPLKGHSRKNIKFKWLIVDGHRV